MKLTRRFRFVLLGVTGVILIVATVLTLRNGSGTDPNKVAGKLGPTPGPNSSGYVVKKRAYLVSLAKSQPKVQAAALVSLEKYVTAPAAQSFASSMQPTAVFIKFPMSEAEPVLVRTTIAGAVADRAADYRHEIDNDIASLEDQSSKADAAQRANLRKAIAERKAILVGVKADRACVYAFAVQGAELAELAAIAKRPEVHLVDVSDPVTNDFGGWELQPIVPKK